MSNFTTQNPGTSVEALRHHYCNVGNEFYRLWLDPTLTYSCALWEENEGHNNLQAAQLRKIDFHIAQARVKGAKRVLDVGCGWGSVLRRLLDVHSVEHAIGITMSEIHYEWISALNNSKLEVHLESWMDHFPKEPYDGIISLEAFEHFTKLDLSQQERMRVYREFFSRCHKWLKPGGWMSLQVNAHGNSRREDSSKFIFTEIFPESDFPTLAEIAQASEHLFEIVMLRNDRQDYEVTCKAWLSRLKANRAAAVELVGEQIVSNYEKYLSFSLICFHQRISNLLRFTLRRIDNPCKQRVTPSGQ
ncbi:MAG: cyclopropane-fatty-acyl-phospholipid synthase [Rhizonema sp. PD38]|nr:cyclopropane-fatty-acyl-phospholipid synthase [Rhizonema sp. PD38]